MGRQAVTDEQLACYVNDELHWDPKVDNRDIAVFVSAGVVTLRGTVGSPWQSREAKRAAQRIRGVIGVENQIQVRPPADDRLEDADLRGDVLQALMLDARIPTSVEASVKDGRVTLSGPVDWRYQREAAEFVAANVPRVASVQNRILLSSTIQPDAAHVEINIRRAIRRDARLDAEAIVVTASGSTVTLSGTVRTWDEHEAALDAAWAAPGVQAVDDRLGVIY